MITIKKTDNEKLVQAIENKLSEDPHCPCRLDKTDDTICPCKEFREQEIGKCHCGLYEKVEVDYGVKDIEKENDSISQYDMMKQILNQCQPLDITEKLMDTIYNLIDTYIISDTVCFLCREKYDFTIFEKVNEEYKKTFISILKEVLTNRGLLLDVKLSNDKCSLDFWIKQKDEILMYKMFDGEKIVINMENEEEE